MLHTAPEPGRPAPRRSETVQWRVAPPPGVMTYREIRDADGRLWEVWEVRPAVIERRQAEDRRRYPREFADRRSSELQLRLLGGLKEGWLTFQCGGERRRLSP